MTLSLIALRSVVWSTVTLADIGYFRATVGSQKGLSGLLDWALSLSVTVGLSRGTKEHIELGTELRCDSGTRDGPLPLA